MTEQAIVPNHVTPDPNMTFEAAVAEWQEIWPEVRINPEMARHFWNWGRIATVYRINAAMHFVNEQQTESGE